jgi:branched-chain amino acid transport system substrate-binding protein
VLLTADLPTVPAGESIFCLNAAPEARGDALARFAVRERHCRRAVVLVDGNDALSAALAAAFSKRWRQELQNDKTASIEEWTWKTDADWPDLCRRTVTAKPDGILVAAGTGVFGRIRSQLLSAGSRAPLIYGGEDVGPTNVANARDDEPPVYLATAFAATTDLGPDGKAFVSAYTDKYHEPPGLPAALAYDAVRLTIDALDRAKAPQAARLTAELTGGSLASVTGPLSLSDRRANRRVFVLGLEKGAINVVATYGPGME